MKKEERMSAGGRRGNRAGANTEDGRKEKGWSGYN